MLPNEGHFTYFYLCDDCHRQIFTTIFGTPLGPLQRTTPDLDRAPLEEEHTEAHESAEDSAEHRVLRDRHLV